MAYVSVNTGVSTQLLGRVSDYFAGLRQSFADHRLYQKTLDELKGLSNRDLADLGMYRGDLHRVAREAVYGQ